MLASNINRLSWNCTYLILRDIVPYVNMHSNTYHGGKFMLFDQKFRDNIRVFFVTTKDIIYKLYANRIKPLGVFGNYLMAGFVLGMGFMLLFAKLAEDLIFAELDLFDKIIISVVDYFNNPLMTAIMKTISTIGSSVVVISIALIACLFFLIARKHYGEVTIILIASAGSALMDELLKHIFHRTRPDIARLVDVSGYSFPSGHAMVSFAFYGMLAYLMWENIKLRGLKYFFALLFALLVLAIGISRIYLGVHYPSDVLAGFAAGGFWLVGCILGLQAIKYYKRNMGN